MANTPKASDTQLRRINKRLEGIVSSLGTNNKLYNDIKNFIMTLYPGRSKNYTRQGGKIALKRGKTSNITPADADAIENYLNRHKLTDYKKEIRKFAKDTGRKAKTIAQYKSLAREMFDLSNEYDDTLQYLYHFHTKPGYNKLMSELSHKGKKLSYAEIKANLDKINKFLGGRQTVSPFA